MLFTGAAGSAAGFLGAGRTTERRHCAAVLVGGMIASKPFILASFVNVAIL
jgi:hypothetical protein